MISSLCRRLPLKVTRPSASAAAGIESRILCPDCATRRNYSSTTSLLSKGSGLGNVHDQMLPTADAAQKTLLFRHTARPLTVSVIGSPMTYGQPFVGTDSSPTLLREAGLLTSLSALGWRVHDQPDIDFNAIGNSIPPGEYAKERPDAKHSLLVGSGCRHLADAVEAELMSGRFPLILGGDHSIGIGSLAGILRARPSTGVIWVDAHADLNTPEMSESGNMHGMPIGLLMEGLVKDHNEIPGLEWLAKKSDQVSNPPRLRADSLVYIGLRDVDRAERAVIRDLGIKAFTMYDIDRYGIGGVMEKALEHLLGKNPSRPIHLSYDIDAVDPIHAPATGTAVRGGLTYREAHFIAESVSKSGALASVEIVEVNPSLSDGDGGEETVELALGLLTSLMGKSII